MHMNEWEVTDSVTESAPHSPRLSREQRWGALPGGAPRGGEDIPGEAGSSSSPPLFGLSFPAIRWGREGLGRREAPVTHSPGKPGGDSPEGDGGGGR